MICAWKRFREVLDETRRVVEKNATGDATTILTIPTRVSPRSVASTPCERSSDESLASSGRRGATPRSSVDSRRKTPSLVAPTYSEATFLPSAHPPPRCRSPAEAETSRADPCRPFRCRGAWRFASRRRGSFERLLVTSASFPSPCRPHSDSLSASRARTQP